MKTPSAPIRSMTGFARVRRPFGGAELVITLKSVNHRALDLHFYSGPEFDPFEHALRGAIKREMARGHLTVRVAVERGGVVGGLSLDRTKLAAYMEAFRSAKEEYGLVCEPDLNSAFRTPGLLVDAGSCELPESAEAEVVEALCEALRTLNCFREREGAELTAILRVRNAAIREAAAKIEEIRELAMPAFHARLRERLGELLSNGSVDPQRLAQEAALLADRSDIGEEIARLQIHSRQLDELLDKGGEIGKRLDFLLQEMNREANTILSKTSGIGETGLGITELALATKADIEKIREQSLNLE